ncbi:hypothetical protein HYZ99_01675 [Candidatus Peregrinibacteria bacterium]|nr:hypothetical protein [Candidatus Peregrinibacteria bacterium]
MELLPDDQLEELQRLTVKYHELSAHLNQETALKFLKAAVSEDHQLGADMIHWETELRAAAQAQDPYKTLEAIRKCVTIMISARERMTSIAWRTITERN